MWVTLCGQKVETFYQIIQNKKGLHLMLFDSQEEQKWLDALEKGELDDYGRVKQDKDVSMMTARQVGFL